MMGVEGWVCAGITLSNEVHRVCMGCMSLLGDGAGMSAL